MLPVTDRPLARRIARTAAAVVAGVPVLLLSGVAAATTSQDDGSDAGDGLSLLESGLYFVVAPVVLFVVIALLVMAPSMARGPRYRPGVGWWAAPVWFNGPDDADTAVRTATATTGGGGASARW